MTKFDEATQAIRVDETTYDVCLDPGYAIGGPLNGGYLMAVILRAVVDASPFEHPVSTPPSSSSRPCPVPPGSGSSSSRRAGRPRSPGPRSSRTAWRRSRRLVTTATLADVEPTVRR